MSALPPLFGVSQDSPDIVCTSLVTCFLIRGTCRGALEKWSWPLTCVPLKAVFACRDCKFSVVEKLNRYIWLTKRLAGLSGSLRAQDKVSRRQWQLQGKDIPVVEKYRHLVVGSTYETRRRRGARLWAKGSSMRTWVKNTKAWLLRRLGSSAVGEIEMSPRGSKTLQRAVQQVIHHKWLTTGKTTQSHTWQEYCQYALQSRSALLHDGSLHFPEYSKSLQWLMRIRVGGWSSCSRLARIGILDEQWKTRCPSCLANVPETLSHLQQKRSVIMLGRIAAAHPRNQSNFQQVQLIATSMGLRALWLVKKTYTTQIQENVALN
ncbi:hypothetical protein GAYE_SCF65G6819 [Galdieria yellowstonensis]|uniref:Uncharacterized protein n=1 Tax=Galdieria yellowstonensis TaxID=3028027 RepID=A0AAV9INY7_9RHOD|nr:hypothetical protein GAYE_SCF65G6819 [Galdieria yellowstonensis]